jgi:endonuclease YncB( thermonuclease family)
LDLFGLRSPQLVEHGRDRFHVVADRTRQHDHFLFCLSLVVSAQAQTFSGKVVSIADGDTLTVLVDRQQVKIRLEGIDTPEKGQPFGTKAKEALSRLVFGKTVAVRSIGTDKYKRTLGRAFVRIDDKTIVVDPGGKITL